VNFVLNMGARSSQDVLKVVGSVAHFDWVEPCYVSLQCITFDKFVY